MIVKVGGFEHVGAAAVNAHDCAFSASGLYFSFIYQLVTVTGESVAVQGFGAFCGHAVESGFDREVHRTRAGSGVADSRAGRC